MPYKEKDIEKLYYSIGEVADIMQINASMLRYWETEFEMLKPKKDRKGNRLFTKADIETVKLIHHLLKECGYTIDGAKTFLKNKPFEARQQFDMVQSLKNVRAFLVSLRDELH